METIGSNTTAAVTPGKPVAVTPGKQGGSKSKKPSGTTASSATGSKDNNSVQEEPLFQMPSLEQMEVFNYRRRLLKVMFGEKADQVKRALETGDLSLVSEEEEEKAANVASQAAQSKVCICGSGRTREATHEPP